MELLKYLPYQNVAAVVCFFFILRVGRTSAIRLCQYEEETNNEINLNMDSTVISRTAGMCSCRIQLIYQSRLTMFPAVTIPGCTTEVSLSDSLFIFPCSNENIKSSNTYVWTKEAKEVLWLFVKTNSTSQTMTGQLQIKTGQGGPKFTVECFDANTNTSTTTTTTPAITTPAITTFENVWAISTKTYKNVSSYLQTASETNPSSTKSSYDGPTKSSGRNIVSSSPTNEKQHRKELAVVFPVAAIAGGIAGGLLLIILVILAVVYLRRRNQETKRLENGGQPSTDQGYVNGAYDSGVSMEPQDTQSSDNTNHVHVENDLYVSADSDNQPQHSQVNLTDTVPGHYASPGDLNIDKSEVESVEGSEVVITSSGDLYAIVDESKKDKDKLVTDTNPTASQADLYAVVDKSKRNQDQLLYDPNPTQDGDYALVDKTRDPQDIDPASMATPSGDVYAVVNKKQDQHDSDTTHTFSPSGDVYAVVDKKQDPQLLDPNHMTAASGDVYAVVEKKPEAGQNHHIARIATYDEEEEAIRRLMDMNDERPSSDTLQSTSL